jgi:hypothetical protein
MRYWAVISSLRWLRRAALGVFLFALASGPVQAAGIGFKSNIPIPVIVQGASTVDNMLRRGAPVVIAPGKLGWDLNLKAGVRFITIYDGRLPTRVLFQGPVAFQGQDMLFTIQPVPRNPFRVAVVQVKTP